MPLFGLTFEVCFLSKNFLDLTSHEGLPPDSSIPNNRNIKCGVVTQFETTKLNVWLIFLHRAYDHFSTHICIDPVGECVARLFLALTQLKIF